MAASRNKRRSSRVVQNFKDLNNLSSVVLYDTASRKRGRLWEVERIITRRKCKSGYEYYLKWKDWGYTACSWEPSENLTQDLLRSFENPPKPSKQRLEEASRNFQCGILAGLRSRRMGPVSVNINHDVWRYLVRGKGEPSDHIGYVLYNKHDFDRLTSLSPHWDYWLDTNGQGAKVDFPLKAKPVLAWSAKTCCVEDGKLIQAPRISLEKVCIYIVKQACDIESC